jgi:hypothetical protein
MQFTNTVIHLGREYCFTTVSNQVAENKSEYQLWLKTDNDTVKIVTTPDVIEALDTHMFYGQQLRQHGYNIEKWHIQTKIPHYHDSEQLEYNGKRFALNTAPQILRQEGNRLCYATHLFTFGSDGFPFTDLKYSDDQETAKKSHQHYLKQFKIHGPLIFKYEKYGEDNTSPEPESMFGDPDYSLLFAD